MIRQGSQSAEGPALGKSAQPSCLCGAWRSGREAQRLSGLPTALGTRLLHPEQSPSRRADALGLLKGPWTLVAHSPPPLNFRLKHSSLPWAGSCDVKPQLGKRLFALDEL